MAHLCEGTVKRYELPGCNGLNFVLTKSLGKISFNIYCKISLLSISLNI